MDGFRVFCSPQKKRNMETNEYIKYMEINNIPYTIDTSPNQETIGKIKVIIEKREEQEKLWYEAGSFIPKRGGKVTVYREVK
jgi:hypothetical protein